jgi:DNA invertase Pin-like site-specific DNA recombinase
MTEVIATRCSDARQTNLSQLQDMPPDLEVFHDDCQRTVPLHERPGLMAAIEAVGDKGVIWVSAFDRIGVTDHLVDIVRMLPDGVTVKTKDGLDIRENELVTFCLGYIAKEEVRTKSQRQSNFAKRARESGKLDCPQSFGFDSETREIIPWQMDALSIAFNEMTAGTKVSEIMRIIHQETGHKIARQRFYDWKKGKHFERIPREYLEKWSKKTETELYWEGYYWELVEEYGHWLLDYKDWNDMKYMCLDSEDQQRMFTKVFLPWLENDNFLLQKPNTDHLVNRKGETFAFGRYSEGFNEV